MEIQALGVREATALASLEVSTLPKLLSLARNFTFPRIYVGLTQHTLQTIISKKWLIQCKLRVKNLSSAISTSKCFFVTQGISTLTGSPGAAPCLHLSGAFLMCSVMCLLPSGLCSFIPLCPIAWLELAGEAVAGCTVRSESSAIACGISHSNCMLCEQKELALLCYERGMLLNLPDHPEKNKIHCKLHLWGQFTSAMGTPSWFWAGSLKSQADASKQLLSCPKSTFA